MNYLSAQKVVELMEVVLDGFKHSGINWFIEELLIRVR